jgi:hypothetical protein
MGLLISFVDFIDLEITYTTDTDRSASYLDLYLGFDREGRLRTKLYNKRDHFNFQLRTVDLDVATFQQHLNMEYISLS